MEGVISPLQARTKAGDWESTLGSSPQVSGILTLRLWASGEAGVRLMGHHVQGRDVALGTSTGKRSLVPR